MMINKIYMDAGMPPRITARLRISKQGVERYRYIVPSKL